MDGTQATTLKPIPPDLAAVDQESPTSADLARVEPNDAQIVVLPSGTTVTVRAGTDGEEIFLRSARGRMELRLRITDDGPVLSLSGVRLEIDAAESVAVHCRDFEVNAREGVRLASAGNVSVESTAEIRMRSAGQTFIDGDYVNLNCLDRTGFHDHVPEDAAQLPEAKEGAP